MRVRHASMWCADTSRHVLSCCLAALVCSSVEFTVFGDVVHHNHAVTAPHSIIPRRDNLTQMVRPTIKYVPSVCWNVGSKSESAACASHVEVPKPTGDDRKPRRTDNVGSEEGWRADVTFDETMHNNYQSKNVRMVCHA